MPSDPSEAPLLAPILQQLRREPSHSWTLVITIYGDAILPRGGSVGMATIAAIFGALGYQNGALRTAMSRLAAAGTLSRNRIGRNSFYTLGEAERVTFLNASAHIYAGRPPAWDGRLRLLLPDDPAHKPASDSRLGTPLPGLFVSPFPIAASDRPNGAIVLDADATVADARRLAARAWQLDDLAARYRRFTALFSRYAPSAWRASLDGLDALALRVLLIHEYRRIVLRDPQLPAEWLPEDWPGGEARALCAAIYRAALDASESWLDTHGACEAGALPPAGPALRARFGLAAAPAACAAVPA